MNPQYNLYVIIVPALIIVLTWLQLRFKNNAIAKEREYVNSSDFHVPYAESQSDEKDKALAQLRDKETALSKSIKYRVAITIIFIIPIVMYIILYLQDK